MLDEAQSRHINLELFKDSNFFSPHPIAAGISNSAHLIAICEFTPPNFVTSPIIL
jgi:hypothetical protein